MALTHCSKAGPWNYNPDSGRFRYDSLPSKCMTVLATYSGVLLQLKDCDESDPRQEFTFTKYDPNGMQLEDLMGPPTTYSFTKEK